MKPMRIEMQPDKQCQGSVRYATADRDAAVKNVYVKRGDQPMPQKIVVTVEAA